MKKQFFRLHPVTFCHQVDFQKKLLNAHLSALFSQKKLKNPAAKPELKIGFQLSVESYFAFTLVLLFYAL